MAYPRCPQRDILSNRLIEAYRDLSFSDSSAAGSSAVPLNPSIVALQSALREHGETCLLCQKIAAASSKKEKAA